MQMFVKKGKDLDFIPPARDALILHTKPAVFQAGYVWHTCLSLETVLPLPTTMGLGVTVAHSSHCGFPSIMLPEPAWNCFTVLAKMSVWTTVTVSDPVKCAHAVHAVGTADLKLLLGWSQKTCGVTVNFYAQHNSACPSVTTWYEINDNSRLDRDWAFCDEISCC